MGGGGSEQSWAACPLPPDTPLSLANCSSLWGSSQWDLPSACLAASSGDPGGVSQSAHLALCPGTLSPVQPDTGCVPGQRTPLDNPPVPVSRVSPALDGLWPCRSHASGKAEGTVRVAGDSGVLAALESSPPRPWVEIGLD